MIYQRRSIHHTADRNIALTPMARDSDATRRVGTGCSILMLLTVVYFAVQFLR